MDLKPCPFCGGKAKQVDICATDFSSANAGGSYIICQSCLACSAVMFGEKAGLSELWNCRALPPKPRTCETCKYDGGATACATCDPTTINWTPRSPQSADVDTVRNVLQGWYNYAASIWGRENSKQTADALAALDRIAGRLGGTV